MKKIHLENLFLRNYRNFSNLELTFNNGLIFLLGENGSGKTNILEAISLLSPGRGLRLAKFDEICKYDEEFWYTNFNMKSKLGIAEIKTDFSLSSRQRTIQYNGSKVASTELINLINIIWLTPQMNGIFLGSISDRRRFLDRIVYNFDPLHAKRINKYEHYTKERLKTLLSNGFSTNDSWLSSLEEKIATEGIDIWCQRQEVIGLMQDSIDKLDSHFPKAKLSISSLFIENIDENNIITYYKEQLRNNRQKDYYSGKTNFGTHRADFIVMHKEKNSLAKLCSTGEQKAMLISIMLSLVDAVISKAKTYPILLLDELFVHLDERRLEYLASYIISSKLQTFITATDTRGLEKLALEGQVIKV